MPKSNLYVVSQSTRLAKVKNTLSGIVHALSSLPEWAGVLATSAGDLAGQVVRDRDVDRIRLWFEDVAGTALSKGHVVDAVRLEEDPWEEVLATWTAERTDGAGALPFSMSELLDSALALPAHSRNPRVTSRVNGLLARLGYEKRKRGSLPRTYFYARRPTPESTPRRLDGPLGDTDTAEPAGVLPAYRPTSSEQTFSATRSVAASSSRPRLQGDRS